MTSSATIVLPPDSSATVDAHGTIRIQIEI